MINIVGYPMGPCTHSSIYFGLEVVPICYFKFFYHEFEYMDALG